MANQSGKRGHGGKDFNVLAWETIQMATGQMEKPEPPLEKSATAVTLGRLGGLKGGKARAHKLTAERRKEIAKKAAAKRWGSD